ncbi:MAG: hypothetical protein PHG81_10400 [Aliarcobacter sp.]|nr:hypothetical protein [Aliarcobacter sp.]
MEISSTNSSAYSAISSSQTSTTQSENNSFDTLLNTQTQETIPPSKMPRTPKIVEFLDRYNKFSTLSPTDEKIFREILSDNKLTKEEADSLSYEQVERISDLLTTNLPLSKEEFGAMPIVQMGVTLTATRATGDRQFNEAFYNTLKEIDSPMDNRKLSGEVYTNLGELYNGTEYNATFNFPDSAQLWDFENMQADYGKFIKDVINHHEAIIADPKVTSVIKPQYQEIVDLYKILQKNYNEVISKAKNDNSENSTSSSTSSTKTTTQKTQKEEANIDKSSTQSLYDDIISLLRTGFTVGELKGFEERLKGILKMMQDKNSGKDITIEDINEAIKQLEREILEAKKSRTGQVLIKTSDNTDSSSNSSSDLESTIGNITNMFKEIKDSSKNTNAKNEEETKNEAYDRLKLLLKMS